MTATCAPGRDGKNLADSARYAAAEARVEEALAGGEPLSTAYRYKADVVAVLRG